MADILFQYGEERASRRIAKAIIAARPLSRTEDLVAAIETALHKSNTTHAHPETRTFQALRIAVKDELGQLIDGLYAAERALKPNGLLVVVTFHSLEDRSSVAVRCFLLFDRPDVFSIRFYPRTFSGK